MQGEEWWVADMQIPYEAAAVNFVVNYFEHYDNNDRQDYSKGNVRERTRRRVRGGGY